MLIFTPPGLSSPVLLQGKELGFNLQPVRSAAREHHLLFSKFVRETFLRERGEDVSSLFLFINSTLSWLNLECVVVQLLQWSLPLGQSMGPAAQHTAKPYLSIFISSFPVS